MPYFHNDDVNILLIHIPKTGGTSIAKYLEKKYDIPYNSKSLYGYLSEETKNEKNINIKTSMQHMTYETIYKYKDYFNIDYKNIRILAAVRNPYQRIISDLFFLRKIKHDSSKKEVFNIMKKYLNEDLDNHNIPQYLFITDENKQLIPNIKILKTETLQKDMMHLGFDDFNEKRISNTNKVNYFDYLNIDSITLINNFFDYDFKLFNYDKITREEIVESIKANLNKKIQHLKDQCNVRNKCIYEMQNKPIPARTAMIKINNLLLEQNINKLKNKFLMDMKE
jgi:hypothetical protein